MQQRQLRVFATLIDCDVNSDVLTTRILFLQLRWRHFGFERSLLPEVQVLLNHIRQRFVVMVTLGLPKRFGCCTWMARSNRSQSCARRRGGTNTADLQHTAQARARQPLRLQPRAVPQLCLQQFIC